MTPLDLSKRLILIQSGPLWAWQNLRGYGRKVHAKFWPWGMPWDRSYDHFCVPCHHPSYKSLLMKSSRNGHMTISYADFRSFITELVTRNPNLGISALEDERFF